MKRCNRKRATAGAHAWCQLEDHSWSMSSQRHQSFSRSVQVFRHTPKRFNFKPNGSISNGCIMCSSECVALLLVMVPLPALFSALSQDLEDCFVLTRWEHSVSSADTERHSWPDRWCWSSHCTQDSEERHTAVPPTLHLHTHRHIHRPPSASHDWLKFLTHFNLDSKHWNKNHQFSPVFVPLYRITWIKTSYIFMIYWPIKWISSHLVQVDEQLAAVLECGTDAVSSAASCGGLILQQPLEWLSVGGEHAGGPQLLYVWETPQQPGTNRNVRHEHMRRVIK